MLIDSIVTNITYLIQIMNTLTKLSIAAASIASLSSLFAGSAFAQTDYQIKATWTNQNDAKCYQIFYKEAGAPNWQFGVRCKDLKSPVSYYYIKGLKAGVSYTYKVKEISNIDNGYKYRWITNEATLPSTLVTTQQ